MAEGITVVNRAKTTLRAHSRAQVATTRVAILPLVVGWISLVVAFLDIKSPPFENGGGSREYAVCPAVMPPWTQVYQRFWTKRQRRVTACRGRASGSGGCGKFIAGPQPLRPLATSHPNGT